MKSFTLLSAFLASASAAVIQPQRVSYDGYKVYRVSVGKNNIGRINDIIEKLNLQTWKSAKKAGSFADIVVHPSQLEAFNKETFDLKPVVMHEDLGVSIAEESAFQPYAVGAVNSTWFNSYHAYADHLQFLQDLVAQFPTNTEIVTSGSSLNGNAITGIHFWGSGGKGVKPAVILHGTVHAREWITTMVVEYYAYTLLTSTDATTKGFLDKYDFYFFPVVNPDGMIPYFSPRYACSQLQDFFTPRTVTDCGGRTDKRTLEVHVSVVISTETGTTSGTFQEAHQPTLVLKTIRVLLGATV